MKKKLLVGVVAFAALVTFWLVFISGNEVMPSTVDRTNSDNITTESIEESTTEDTRIVRLVATGDMIPHDTVNARSEEHGGQPYVGFFNSVQPLLDDADILFCNQESPSAPSFAASGYPAFNAPIEFPQALSTIGCNLINLANNHMADKGVDGIRETLETWKPLGAFAVAGANVSLESQQQVATFTVEGKTFAFVAFNEFSNNTSVPSYAVNSFEERLVINLMQQARDKADFIIVSAHWGVENQEVISPFQEQWAKKLADQGADIIVGTGPHVVQKTDIIEGRQGKQTTVFYSLGNALSTQLKTEELFGAFAVVDLEIDDDLIKIAQRSVFPVYMHYEWSAADASSENLLARRNLQLVPLDKATDLLQQSQLQTTVKAQLARLKRIMINDNFTLLRSSDI